MPKVRRSTCSVVLLLVASTLLCGLLAGGALILLSIRGSQGEIGQADPGLSPVARLFLAGYLYARHGALDQPAGSAEAEVDLDVSPGDAAAVVVQDLREAGVVREAGLLSAYLRYRGLDKGVQAGRYHLSGTMTVRQIADALQHARAPSIRLLLPEGWRMEQMAEAMVRLGAPFSASEFLSAAHIAPSEISFAADLPATASLEGFLFPDTYDLGPDSAAQDLVALMAQDFDRRVTADMRAAFSSQGLSLYQAVTLASIVEREAAIPEERGPIASVFLNRISRGMNLDADPTVQYALDRQPDGGWWKAPLSLQDLDVDSPYNTYRNPGLPPGPICSPGLGSLQAVAAPPQTPYLYFRAACDGSGRHLFAQTFEQHSRNACP